MEKEIIVKGIEPDIASNGIYVKEVKTDNKSSVMSLIKSYWALDKSIDYTGEVSRKDFWLVNLISYALINVLCLPLFIIKSGSFIASFSCSVLIYNFIASSSFSARRCNNAGVSKVWSILFYTIIGGIGTALMLPFLFDIVSGGNINLFLQGTPTEVIKESITPISKPKLFSFLFGSLLWVISAIFYTIIGVLGDQDGKR